MINVSLSPQASVVGIINSLKLPNTETGLLLPAMWQHVLTVYCSTERRFFERRSEEMIRYEVAQSVSIMPATHAQETCIKNLTQVYHSFLHQNNSPANHVARFVSWARQFLWWNRAVFYCVQKNLYQIDQHRCKFLVQDDLYQFLKRVSPALMWWQARDNDWWLVRRWRLIFTITHLTLLDTQTDNSLTDVHWW